jgi:hypothetical protein
MEASLLTDSSCVVCCAAASWPAAAAVMERWAKQAGTTNVAKMRHLDDHKDIHLPKGFEVFTVSGCCSH